MIYLTSIIVLLSAPGPDATSHLPRSRIRWQAYHRLCKSGAYQLLYTDMGVTLGSDDIQLLTAEDQTLLSGRNALFLFDLLLYFLDLDRRGLVSARNGDDCGSDAMLAPCPFRLC